MSSERLPEGHEWISKSDLQIQGMSFSHRQCVRCGRDFAKLSAAAEWSAVHVGVFKFNSLDENTTHRWFSERCPGYRLPEEMNDLRVARREH
jgi:hypothetical protein